MLVYRPKKDDDAVFFVLIVVALCEVGLYRMIRRVICRYASVFCILSYAVRCCRGLPNSLAKEVFHFLRSL